MLLSPQKLALGTMKSPQLPQPCQKRSLHVTACLRCAAQQPQQIVRLPTAVKPCQQQGTLQYDATAAQQQPLPEQFHQVWQQALQRPAQPQLAMATAGFGPISPSQHHYSSSKSSSSSSAGSITQSAHGISSSTSKRRHTSRQGHVGAAGRDADSGAAAEQHTRSVEAISGSQPSSSTAGCLPSMQQQPLQHNSTGHHTYPQFSQGPGPASPSSTAAPGDQPHTQLLQQQPALASSSPSQQQQQQQQSATDGEVDSPGVRAALAALRWYKGFLSPSMAATCRFQPTCSQYSMDSYRKYGVAKGTVLTAWRLLRCNPWGGSGYDPTSWPPIGLAPLFTLPYSAEVAVVVGTAVVLRFTHALLFE